MRRPPGLGGTSTPVGSAGIRTWDRELENEERLQRWLGDAQITACGQGQ
ncbi:hypothetical protein [Streptomyces sp. NPDC050504]